MKRIELTSREILDEGRSVLVDHHSLLNLLNVLERELESLHRKIVSPDLKHYSEFCVDVLMELSRPVSPEQMAAIEARFRDLSNLIGELSESHPQHHRFLAGILEILEVASSRLHEFRRDRLRWTEIPVDEFDHLLQQFLRATERVSQGRFRFVKATEAIPRNGYRIDFLVRAQKHHLLAPPVLQDVIRDLVGNSRKYSQPGTTITVRLIEEADGLLRLKVWDEGMGIPEEELDKVVSYGYRASNVRDRKTMGAGLGLTKAFQLCKRFNGRFFIASALGEGTCVELTLIPPA